MLANITNPDHYVPLTGHVLQHVRLVEDDVVEVELAEEDAVVGRADHHVVRCQDDVKLDLLVHNLNYYKEKYVKYSVSC